MTTTPHPYRPGLRIGAAWAPLALALTLAGPLAAQQLPPPPARTPDVVFVPTAMEIVEAMLAVTRVRSSDVVYDLGCGDGRIVITAVKRHGARGVCVDIDPTRIAESRRNADTAGVAGRIRFRNADLFETDLREATVVTLYLLPTLNARLRPKLFRELRPGTRVVSNAFDMGDWKADSVLEVKTPSGIWTFAYYWLMPADVAGAWRLETDAGAAKGYALRLQQRYQEVTGTAEADGRSVPIEGLRLRGDRLSFTLRHLVGGGPAEVRFAGVVKGDRIVGEVADGAGQAGAWTAVRRERGPRPELEPAEGDESR